MEFHFAGCYCEESNKHFIRSIIRKLIKRDNGRFKANAGITDILTLDGASLRSIIANYGQAQITNVPSRTKKIKSQLKSWGDGDKREPLGPYMGFDNKSIKERENGNNGRKTGGRNERQKKERRKAARKTKTKERQGKKEKI